MRPLISKNRAATIRRQSVPPRLREIRVPTTPEIRAYHSARRYCANILCRWMAQVDDGKRVSWFICSRASVRRAGARAAYRWLRFAQRSGYSSMAGRKFASSSVAPLAIGGRGNLPAIFQCLAYLGLSELLLLRKIFPRVARLTVLRDKLRRLNVVRFPIEIENLIIRPQIILWVPMTIQAPRHAVGLGDVHHRHVIDRAVASEAADAPVHVR